MPATRSWGWHEAEEWLRSHVRDSVRLLLAADPDPVATLMERARALLVTDGELGQPGPSRSTA